MGGHVSLDVVLNVVLVDEAIQNVDQVLGLLKVIHQVDEVVNSRSRVLQDSIKVGKGVGEDLVVTPHFLDDLKERSDDHLCLFLVLGKDKCVKYDIPLTHRRPISKSDHWTQRTLSR